MADTIRVTKSNIVVLESNAPVGETHLRITKSQIVVLSGVSDVSYSPPAGRSQVIVI